jgi:hypothetical protein
MSLASWLILVDQVKRSTVAARLFYAHQAEKNPVHHSKFKNRLLTFFRLSQK